MAGIYKELFSDFLEDLAPDQEAWFKAEFGSQADKGFVSREFCYEFSAEKEVKGKTVRCLSFYSENGHGDPKAVCELVQQMFKTFELRGKWFLEYAQICDKPQPGAFGGGIIIVTADKLEHVRTLDIAEALEAEYDVDDAVYVSVWEGTIKCESPCKFDKETLLVYDVPSPASAEEPDTLKHLKDEYVLFEGKQFRKADGITFHQEEEQASDI